MNHDRLIDELPDTLAVALRLKGAGYDDDTVATALGIPAEGVAGVLQLARRKLQTLRQQDADLTDSPQRVDT